MPLRAKAADPRSVYTVHDGAMFAKEFRHTDPRSPEANRILLDGLGLEPSRPIFVSPRCSYLQVCSDVGLSGCDWMAQRSRVFCEGEQRLLPEEVTPPLAAPKRVTRTPNAPWTANDDDAIETAPAPPVPFVRRKIIWNVSRSPHS